MNILLTGSDGFVGSHLFHQLKEEHDVIGFDIKNGHDILNSELPKDIDLVIHLAGLSGVKDSLNRPTDYWKTNVIGLYLWGLLHIKLLYLRQLYHPQTQQHDFDL